MSKIVQKNTTTQTESWQSRFREKFVGENKIFDTSVVKCKRKEEHPCVGWHSIPYLNSEEKEELMAEPNSVIDFISNERKLLLEEVKGLVEENTHVFDGAVTVEGVVDKNDLLSALTKLQEKE